MFTLASDKPAIDLKRDIDPVVAAAAVGQLHIRMSLLPLTPTAQSPASLEALPSCFSLSFPILMWHAITEFISPAEGVSMSA